MEYPMCTQSVKRKEFLVQLVYKKDRFSIGNFKLFGYSIFKNIEIFRVKELFKSNQTRYGVSHVYLERKRKSFGLAWLGKKFVFQSEISAYSLIIRLFYFQKYRNFIGSRRCPNRANHGMEYPMCTQSVKRKEFLVQLVYKRSSFSNRKFRLIRLFYFQKYRNFIESRSCPNRTKLGMVYPMCTQSVKRKHFLEQLVYKKFVFQSEISTYSVILFSKIQKFYRVKELSKSNEPRYGVSHVYLKRKTKRIFGLACLQKRSFFNRKFRLIRLFYFQKYRNFIGSRSCPNRTNHGMEYPMCT